MNVNPNRRKRRSACGQAVDEYAAALAFVAAIVAMVFMLPLSSLYNAVSAAFQSATSAVVQLLAGL